MISIYGPPLENSEFFQNSSSNIIDHFTNCFDNYVIIGDFITHSNGLYNLIKGHVYFKGKGSLIDLILTNRNFSFKITQLFETGLSDHHHLVYTETIDLQRF